MLIKNFQHYKRIACKFKICKISTLNTCIYFIHVYTWCIPGHIIYSADIDAGFSILYIALDVQTTLSSTHTSTSREASNRFAQESTVLTWPKALHVSG